MCEHAPPVPTARAFHDERFGLPAYCHEPSLVSVLTLLCFSRRYDRDFDYDFFGFKTLERSYLIKMHNKTVERPQHMLMRVALGIHLGDIDAAIETYTLMSEKWFTHASPTMFNAGTPTPQMSSCFLLSMVRVCQPLHLAQRCLTPPRCMRHCPPGRALTRYPVVSWLGAGGRLDRGHLRHAEALCAHL